MRAAITFSQTGAYTTIQDGGRKGHQAFGVPEGGALDRAAMVVGNALVGNQAMAAGLEICLGGVAMHFTQPRRVALTGTIADTMTLEDAFGQAITLPPNRSLRITAGMTLKINVLTGTNTVFLAIEGGIDVPLLYGSASTSPSAMIGGVDGRLLRPGDTLALDAPASEGAEKPADDLMLTDTALFDKRYSFRVVLGPQDDRFTDGALKTFLSHKYLVSPALNRMGMRLTGAKLEHRDNADIASDGIVTGSVQVPGDGMPIILLADHQTTGGYTKIATVISADLAALARLKPQDEITFEQITVAKAESLAHEQAARTAKAISSLTKAPALLDSIALYQLGDTTG